MRDAHAGARIFESGLEESGASVGLVCLFRFYSMDKQHRRWSPREV